MIRSRAIRTTFLAGGLLVLAGRAMAAPLDDGLWRDALHGDDPAVAVASMTGKLADFATALGVTAPPVPEAALRSALTAALPEPPADEPRNWSTSVGFDIHTTVTTARDGGAEPTLRDARGCEPEDYATPVEIVRFRRIDRRGLMGHECVITLVRDGVWAVRVVTVAQGEGRRLEVSYVVAHTVRGDPDRSREDGEARLQANIDLGEALADYGIGLLVQARIGDGLDVESSLDRLNALAARLSGPENDGAETPPN